MNWSASPESIRIGSTPAGALGNPMVQWTGEDQTDQRLASGCRNYRGSEWSSVALTKKLRALLASSSEASATLAMPVFQSIQLSRIISMPTNTEPFLWLLWHTILMRILVPEDNKPQVSLHWVFLLRTSGSPWSSKVIRGAKSCAMWQHRNLRLGTVSKVVVFVCSLGVSG